MTARTWCIKLGIQTGEAMSDIPQTRRMEVRRLLEAGYSRSAVAAELSITPAIVGCVLALSPGLKEKRASLIREQFRVKWRPILKSAVDRHPSLSRSQLRLRCQAAYSWLLVHDRDWLEALLPKKVAPTGHSQMQLDWGARDQVIAKALTEAVPAIRAKYAPAPLRVWMLRREMPDKAPNFLKLHRLPLTRQAIREAVGPARGRKQHLG